MKLMMFAASLSQDSCNKKLIQVVEQYATALKATVHLSQFADYMAPHYNADIQKVGFPDEITHFTQHLAAADALVISSPEYNYSTPGTLKNLIDWVSRLNPLPFRGYPILLLSASPSLVGGNRGLWSTRVPLEACGAHVYPDMFSLASAYDAFNAEGQLKDKALSERLKTTLASFMHFAEQVKK